MQLHVNVYLFLAHIWPRRTNFTSMSPKIIVFLTQINPQFDKKVGQTHSNYFEYSNHSVNFANAVASI